jgi:hypothetical protein
LTFVFPIFFPLSLFSMCLSKAIFYSNITDIQNEGEERRKARNLT